MSPLEARLLAAHAAGNGAALAGLYAEAAQAAAGAAERAFFLTQAYVYALECGDARADGLRQSLRAMGREE